MSFLYKLIFFYFTKEFFIIFMSFWKPKILIYLIYLIFIHWFLKFLILYILRRVEMRNLGELIVEQFKIFMTRRIKNPLLLMSIPLSPPIIFFNNFSYTSFLGNTVYKALLHLRLKIFLSFYFLFHIIHHLTLKISSKQMTVIASNIKPYVGNNNHSCAKSLYFLFTYF